MFSFLSRPWIWYIAFGLWTIATIVGLAVAGPVAAITTFIIGEISGLCQIIQAARSLMPSSSSPAVSPASPTTSPPTPPSTSRPRLIRGIFKIIIAVILMVLSFLFVFYNFYYYLSYQSSSCTPHPQWKVFSVLNDHDPVNASKQGNECIGISDGGFRLDSGNNLGDGPDMTQAAQAYREGDSSTANSFWEKAKKEEQKDAEPFIYVQNQSVDTSQSYYDVLVVTMLSGDNSSVNIGRDELQGFSIALNDYNAHRGQGLPIRFLIANVGNESNFASQVEPKIKELADNDGHLIGILGWPTSGNHDIVTNAIHDLAQKGLPIISPTATADDLSQQNSYFFRMSPTNAVQAETDAKLVQKAFQDDIQNRDKQTINVAVLTRTDNAYSTSLSKDFETVVKQPSYSNIHIIPIELGYTQNTTGQIPSEVQTALSRNADIIYVSGFSDDAQAVLSELQAKDPSARIKVVGGDGLAYTKDYPYSGYPPEAKSRLYYTSFTIPSPNCEKDQPAFYTHYHEIFGICPGNDAILAHDAALTMFSAISPNQTSDINVARDNLWKNLKGINNLNPLSIPGMVTGTVTFQNGDRADPITESFFVGPDGTIQHLQKLN